MKGDYILKDKPRKVSTNSKGFYKFITERVSKVVDKNSNNLGTALFIAGEIDVDKSLISTEAYNFIGRLPKSNIPKIGYLAGWKSSNNSLKLGVVLGKTKVGGEEDFVIGHRIGRNGVFRKQTLQDLSRLCKQDGKSILYHIPKKFEEEF